MFELPELDADGLLSGTPFIPSPNFDERPPGTEITLVVVHAISLPPNQFGGPGVEQLFTNRIDSTEHPYYETLNGLRVSTHFFIRRDGAVVQFVPCAKRAWHAGVSSWHGIDRCNDFSVGIELEGCDELPFEAPQYESLARLIVSIEQRYPVGHVAGHADVAPGRKTDPGPYFEWSLLHALLTKYGVQRVATVQR